MAKKKKVSAYPDVLYVIREDDGHDHWFTADEGLEGWPDGTALMVYRCEGPIKLSVKVERTVVPI